MTDELRLFYSTVRGGWEAQRSAVELRQADERAALLQPPAPVGRISRWRQAQGEF